jgi:hypothetical protein
MPDSHRYIAACFGARPAFEPVSINVGDFVIHKSVYSPGTFDVHSLGAHHKVHFPYVLLDVFWFHVGWEMEVIGAKTLDEAKEKFSIFRTMLYAQHVNPFIIPFIGTHSKNDISGMNNRDSGLFGDDFPSELRSGITSKTDEVEIWPHELSFFVLRNSDGRKITEQIANNAGQQAHKWEKLENKHKELQAVRHIMETAPTIDHLGTSLLHIWTALESFFPNVRTEVSFRMALLLAELASVIQPPLETYQTARRSYGHRSHAAHGNLKKLTHKEWDEAWKLLCIVVGGVIQRGALPDEGALISSILTS